MHDIITLSEETPEYHYKFSTIKGKPRTIYALGNLTILDKSLIAIVGPRRPSGYAERILEELFTELIHYDIATISGLAPGVDQLCHRSSFKKDIPTIAVLGGGLERYLASSNRRLIEQIVEKGGLVLSEFPLDLLPQTYTFAQRNRIIAGLSDLVFLPEAGKKSGSLITVDFANAMQKPIYGVPNHLYASQSEGLLEYLQDGKLKPVINFSRMLQQHFGWKKKAVGATTLPSPDQCLSPEDHQLLSCLRDADEAHVDALAYHLQLAPHSLMTQLTLLEMKQLVYQSAPGMWRTTRK